MIVTSDNVLGQRREVVNFAYGIAPGQLLSIYPYLILHESNAGSTKYRALYRKTCGEVGRGPQVSLS